MQPVFAGTTRQDCRPAKTVDDVGDSRERIGCVAARFLEIAGELCPQMARQPPEKRAGQRDRRALGRNIFLAIFTDGKACDRTCRIKEDIILAVVARSIQPCGKILVRGQREIDFKKAGVPQQLRTILARHFRELVGSGEHQRLVTIFVIAVMKRLGAFLRNHD